MTTRNNKFAALRIYNFLLGGLLIVGACIDGYSNSRDGLIHFPVKNATQGNRILIEAKIEQPGASIQYMRLYFRVRGESDYQFIEMDEQLDSYTGDIPAEVVKSPGVEYFILALMQDRSMATSPLSNPYYSPHEVTVTPPSQQPTAPAAPKQKTISSASGVDLEVVILSPEPNERINIDEAVIAVSFLGETEKLAEKSIRLFINGKDFSSQAEISQNMLSYVPKNLSSGAQRIKIELADTQGNRFDDISWQFYTTSHRSSYEADEPKPTALPFSGNVFAEFRNEKVTDSTLTTTNFGGNIRGQFGPLKYHGKVFVTSRENPDFQPRNRFLLEVGTSWIGVKLGDTSPRFNELMLWGRRVRGVEAYLMFGFFNLEFVQGETNREVEGIAYQDIYLPVIDDSSKFINPATNDTIVSITGIYRYGVFKQNLLALRPSFGSGKNFQLGFNVVKVKDDINSIQHSTQPKDNLVVGPDLMIAFDNHRIVLKASAAFSLLANDISNGAISAAEFDTTIGELPFDPAQFEKYFVLNTSLIPLDPSKLSSLAYQTSFKFNYFNNDITAVYKSIGSEYNSLANSFLRKDIQGFAIYDRIRLFQNKVYLNLGYEKYLEGVSLSDDGEDTTEPNDFSSISAGISFYPREPYLPKINLNWKSYDRNNGLDTSVTYNAVNYATNDLSLQLGYDISVLGLSHNISLSHIRSDRIDGFQRTSSELANNIQMYSLKTDFQIPLTTVISYASNENIAGGGLNGFEYDMFGISATYRLLNGKLRLKTGFNTTNAVGSYTSYVDSLGNPLAVPAVMNYTQYKRTAFNFGGSFEFFKKHNLLWDFSFIDFNDKMTAAFKNQLVRIRYQMRY